MDMARISKQELNRQNYMAFWSGVALTLIVEAAIGFLYLVFSNIDKIHEFLMKAGN